MIPPPPKSSPLPYTTLFRSQSAVRCHRFVRRRGPVQVAQRPRRTFALGRADRKSTRLNSSHLVISYAVFCLKKKKVCDVTHHRPSRPPCASPPTLRLSRR